MGTYAGTPTKSLVTPKMGGWALTRAWARTRHNTVVGLTGCILAGAANLIDHGGRLWDTEYCTVTRVDCHHCNILTVAGTYLATGFLVFQCFWSSFAISCLCKKSCVSTVHSTCIRLPLQRGDKQLAMRASCQAPGLPKPRTNTINGDYSNDILHMRRGLDGQTNRQTNSKIAK